MGKFFHDKRVWLGIALTGMVLSTAAAGIFFQHYFVVCVFAVWMCVEVCFWRWRYAMSLRSKPEKPAANDPIQSLLLMFAKETPEFDREALQLVSELRNSPSGLALDQQSLDGIVELIDLRQLLTPQGGRGKKALREAFLFALWGRRSADRSDAAPSDRLSFFDITPTQIMEAAMHVSDRLWRLVQLASTESPVMSSARELYRRIFAVEFEQDSARPRIEILTDLMQKDGGIPFLVLNLLKKGQIPAARQVTQALLSLEEQQVDEELRSTLYWLSEIYWFSSESNGLMTDPESVLRYIYHLCFTNPDRAGFLEIDSQFFSQFESVNQLAQEGFLFKESLIERTLEMWKDYGDGFSGIFKTVLENMTQQRSKIFDELVTWDRFWKRESENFGREYLYVVEGNLCYAAKQYEDAKTYYEKALKLNPELRPALLNLVFCYARLGLKEQHQALVERLVEDRRLLPSALYVVADSFILMGKDAHADAYYQELAQTEEWTRKVDYYRSTFCFEQGIFDKALEYAKRAHDKNPMDPSIRYHLSLCYNAAGEKEEALKLLDGMMESPQWMNYYRFTLERDSGKHQQASETLLRIPSDYFDDPDELEAALSFARHRRDLVLLRHLRQK